MSFNTVPTLTVRLSSAARAVEPLAPRPHTIAAMTTNPLSTLILFPVSIVSSQYSANLVHLHPTATRTLLPPPDRPLSENGARHYLLCQTPWKNRRADPPGRWTNPLTVAAVIPAAPSSRCCRAAGSCVGQEAAPGRGGAPAAGCGWWVVPAPRTGLPGGNQLQERPVCPHSLWGHRCREAPRNAHSQDTPLCPRAICERGGPSGRPAAQGPLLSQSARSYLSIRITVRKRCQCRTRHRRPHPSTIPAGSRRNLRVWSPCATNPPSSARSVAGLSDRSPRRRRWVR